jgi:hypothetical protein
MVALLFSGCDLFEQRNRAYDDDPVVEFFPLSQTVDESDLDDNGVNSTGVPIEIQLIGPQRDSELSVSVSAFTDTSLSAGGAQLAEEGVHYRLPSSSATIPADSSQTTVNVEVLNNGDDDGDTNYVLFLDLEGSDGVAAAENLDRHRLTFRGADE